MVGPGGGSPAVADVTGQWMKSCFYMEQHGFSLENMLTNHLGTATTVEITFKVTRCWGQTVFEQGSGG